jgi:hypothetical protein
MSMVTLALFFASFSMESKEYESAFPPTPSPTRRSPARPIDRRGRRIRRAVLRRAGVNASQRPRSIAFERASGT